jgi:hypothetical protein
MARWDGLAEASERVQQSRKFIQTPDFRARILATRVHRGYSNPRYFCSVAAAAFSSCRQTPPPRMMGPHRAMSDIKIEVWDATGNKRQLVEAPADAEVNRLIAVLIDRMNLPRHSPDGQMMSYKFHHKSSGRQLLDTETLASGNVKDGDVLRLQPEITAGALLRQPRSPVNSIV